MPCLNPLNIEDHGITNSTRKSEKQEMIEMERKEINYHHL